MRVLSCVVLVAATASLHAQPQFQPAQPLVPTGVFWGFTFPDIEGDGDVDLVTACPQATNQLRIFENDGTGQFTEIQAFDTGDWVGEVAAADLDGDGDLDLVAINNQLIYRLNVFLNDGTGTYVPGPTVTLDGLMRDVTLADLNGDGDPDVIMADWLNEGVEVRLGDGAGGFGADTKYPLNNGKAFGVVASDLDGDGDRDVAATSYGTWPGSGALTVLWNDGSGAFPGSRFLDAGNGTWSVTVGDLDCDGLDDLVATNRNTNSITVHQNLGGGNFATEVSYSVGAFPISASLLDLEGDGDLDVCVPSSNSPWTHMLLNDGAGGFTPTRKLQGVNYYDGAAADLDGDQAPDVVVLSNSDILWYRNLTHQSWVDLGSGLAGTHGEPALKGVGSLAAGGVVSVELKGARANSSAFFVVGVSTLNLPFFGGTLVPYPDLILVLGTGAAGKATLAGSVPANLPPGTEMFLHTWIVDPVAPAGFAATNALRGESF